MSEVTPAIAFGDRSQIWCPGAGRREFVRQAGIARTIGSPFVAAVLEAGERQLDCAPHTATLIDSWPGDPAAAALALRFNAAIHALARRGRPERLAALFRREHQDFDGAVAAALAAEDAFVVGWMRQPTQTNEVGRAAAIVAALTVAAARFGLPFELLELGSSAGLNLNLARMRHRLGERIAGDPEAPLTIAPQWRGPPAPDASVVVLAAEGVDLHPLDVAREATRDRLLSFVFADQPVRAERLQNAIALARRYPPRVTRADAVPWLAERLAVDQPDGRCRAVFHSMVLQYLSIADRAAVTELITAAGARATMTKPLAWIGFEWTEGRDSVQLRLTTWPGGETQCLATCHPYGAWIEWHG